MVQLSRRRLVGAAPLAWAVPGAWAGLGGMALSACSYAPDEAGYDALAASTWPATMPGVVQGATAARPPGTALTSALGRELVRCATLAPSSHNTQCWRFRVDGAAITILPDLSRRCPAVDPVDHHLFVSLGCAAENLVQAALAHGLLAVPVFDAAQDSVRVALSPTAAQASPLYQAIAARQSTRGDYDGRPLAADDLALLNQAGSANGVRLLLLTERPAIDRVLAQVVDANTLQMADPVFVREIRSWIRFNGAQAAHTRDGLYSACSGNPNIPTWLGEVAFDWVFTPGGEKDKIARQLRSSAGVAVFVGEAADKAHWVAVGRASQRFALQATALGIRCAFLNQPVEVAAARASFAASLGLPGQRPDLVLRFGRGPALPRSLRRPVDAVLV